MLKQTRDKVIKCSYCGNDQTLHFMDDVNEHLEESQMCHTCDYWNECSKAPNRLISKGCFYVDGGAKPKDYRGMLGFAGRDWIITLDDGRVIETNNLWNGSKIPELWRDRMPDNCVVEMKRYEYNYDW